MEAENPGMLWEEGVPSSFSMEEFTIGFLDLIDTHNIEAQGQIDL